MERSERSSKMAMRSQFEVHVEVMRKHSLALASVLVELSLR
jgi:hypothetical protein